MSSILSNLNHNAGEQILLSNFKMIYDNNAIKNFEMLINI